MGGGGGVVRQPDFPGLSFAPINHSTTFNLSYTRKNHAHDYARRNRYHLGYRIRNGSEFYAV